MKVTSQVRGLILFSVLIVISASICSAQSGNSCGALIGEWNWTTSGVVTNGVVTLKDDHSVLYNGLPLGTWECKDDARHAATIHWANGFVDSVTLAGDRISGTSSMAGVSISGTRKGSAPASGAVPGIGGGYSVVGANAYVRAKNWNGLVAYAKAWTQAQPNEPLAWFYLGNAYGPLNQPQSSIQPFQRASQLKSPWPEVWNGLGGAYMLTKQFSQAVEAFTKATEQNPKRMQYWNNLASAQTELGNFGLAQKALDAGKQAAGDSARAGDWYVLANGYRQLKMMSAAVDAFKRCLQLDGRLGPAWNNLGATLEYLGNIQGALQDYQQAAALGDAYGKTNYANLQNMLEQARQQSGGNPDIMARLIERNKKERQARIESYSIAHGVGYGTAALAVDGKTQGE